MMDTVEYATDTQMHTQAENICQHTIDWLADWLTDSNWQID